MCFLFLGDEFSATALLPEETRIKNTYTDGTYLCACIIKYICPKRYTVFATLCAIRGRPHRVAPTNNCPFVRILRGDEVIAPYRLDARFIKRKESIS